MIGLILKGNVAGNGEFDLRAGGGAAENMEPRADPVRPLAHSRKAPVSIAPRSQYLRVDPATIVAHQNTQLAGRILQFDLDLLRPRMAKCIDQRFPADSVHFVPEQRAQGPPLTVDNDAKVDVVAACSAGQSPAGFAKTRVRDPERRSAMSAILEPRSGPLQSLAPSIEEPGSASA